MKCSWRNKNFPQGIPVLGIMKNTYFSPPTKTLRHFLCMKGKLRLIQSKIIFSTRIISTHEDNSYILQWTREKNRMYSTRQQSKNYITMKSCQWAKNNPNGSVWRQRGSRTSVSQASWPNTLKPNCSITSQSSLSSSWLLPNSWYFKTFHTFIVELLRDSWWLL